MNCVVMSICVDSTRPHSYLHIYEKMRKLFFLGERRHSSFSAVNKRTNHDSRLPLVAGAPAVPIKNPPIGEHKRH